MGYNIEKVEYQSNDFSAFRAKIHQQLDELKVIIADKNFGHSTLKMGAELEMYLVDHHGEVSLTNQQLIKALDDPQYQPELNQYNLELNLSPVSLAGKPFSNLRNQMQQKTAHLEEIAQSLHVNVIPIGILPTLKKEHMNLNHMTDLPRYHCLSNHLYKVRGEAFKVNINGDESLSIDFEDICAEGANTSFQVHLMIEPEKFSAVYNAAQLTLPLVTAIGANSAIFLGKRLWDETRIALFKQSIDIRQPNNTKWQEQPRVNFGVGWLHGSPWQLFSQAVSLFPPIMPEVSQALDSHKLPSLHELSLHLGTTWPWNRPVYSNEGNGHIRLEFRAIPAGPTSIDMVANAAFAIGLATAMAENIDEYISVLPFQYAEYNFYRAAQDGLNAKILWPFKQKYQIDEVSIKDVISQLISVAKTGLLNLDIDEEEADTYLAVIQKRLDSGITGATWQKRTLETLEKTLDKNQACQKLTQLYIQHCRSCLPVSEWELL